MPLLNLTRVNSDVVSRELKTMTKQPKAVSIKHDETLAHGIARNILSPHLANLVSWKLNKPKRSLDLARNCVMPDQTVHKTVQEAFTSSVHAHKSTFAHELCAHIKENGKSRSPLSQLTSGEVKPLIDRYFQPTIKTLKNALNTKADDEMPSNRALQEIRKHRPDATQLELADLDLPVSNETKANIHYSQNLCPFIDTQTAIEHLRRADALAEHPQTKADIHYMLALCNDGDPISHLVQAAELAVYHGSRVSIDGELNMRRTGRQGTTREQMIFISGRRHFAEQMQQHGLVSLM